MNFIAVEGRFHEEDNSYSAGETLWPRTEQCSTAHSALARLQQFCDAKRHCLEHEAPGMFFHLPGVVSKYVEKWSVRGKYRSRIWLIRRIDNL